MTEKGRQFTLESRRRAALDSKRKFNRKLLLFEKLVSELRSRDATKSELQALKVLVENTLQEFVDCLNLATNTEDIHCKYNYQRKTRSTCLMGENLLQSITSSGLFGFERRNEIKLVERISSVELLTEICKDQFVLQRRSAWCHCKTSHAQAKVTFFRLG